MATIFIVKRSTGGYYTSASSHYFHTEEEAQERFDSLMESVGEDPTLIELVRLDTETLKATTICGWEGTSADLEDEG